MLGPHQLVEDLDEILAVEAGPPGGLQGGLQAVLHLAQQLLAHEGRVQRQDVGALAGDRGDEPLGGQLGVGAVGGDDADPQVTREGADGGQGAVLGQLPLEDGRADLLLDLLIERYAGTVGQHHPHDGLRSPTSVHSYYIQLVRQLHKDADITQAAQHR